MRRISMWALSTVVLLVLLFSYRTSTGSGATTSTAAVVTESGEGESFTGDTISTREGDVQVVITVASGKITGVTVPVYPSGEQRHEEINAAALPVLVEETLAAQSADIDGVSGATYTSDGYKQSLQSALDAAGIS
ncbi:FMN-binding protein [Actinoplanes sp. NPDC051851]|uniref:FMN-binding protein n=1 Tax=Actinoplanes sp. NPDC051851 TaxID=3154753 RepID=UPI0034443E94